ncbi:MAG TPA: elongation factor G [Planctomycetaceae bacterium]|nr:elongation factor G [Planctomycetaceae bacterium]HRA86722.1 elongation factor G [Planctomycetaceae bacterium]
MSDISLLRNIGISAHIDSGKTTLTERILYYSGRIHKMREVKGGDGGATMDHMDLERERGITITSAATRVEWKDEETGIMHPINIIDTPGHVDFTVEVERSLRVLDGAILVLCAVGGVQSQSLTVDRQMRRYGVPRIAFINKMDRTGANPTKVMAAMKEKLRCNAVPLQIPMGLESAFEGVIDLIRMEAVFFEGEKGDDVIRKPIPEQYKAAADKARREMLEELSLHDDDLMAALLEETEVSVEDIRKVIRRATLAQQIVPVLMGTAFKDKGVQEALDAVVRFLPSPPERDKFANDNSQPVDEHGHHPKVLLSDSNDAPLVAMAFKTVVENFGQLTYTRIYQGKIVKGQSYVNARTGRTIRFGRLVRMHSNDREDIDLGEAGDIIAVVGVDCASGDTFTADGVPLSLENIFVANAVIRLSIAPKKRDDADRLSKALERFRREDPTFRVLTDEETGETLIAGMGQLHLEIYVERIKREYKCECIVGEPRVAYRECPTKAVEYNYKHKKQSGGSGQYAHIVGVLEPLPDNYEKTYEFVDEVSGGRIPREFIAPVDAGFQLSLPKGPLGEYEVVGVRMRLQDGSYHDVDSSEMAFKICGIGCMRETLKKADMTLQEPIMKLEIETPDEYQGQITGHISSKRGLVTGSEVTGGICVINAEAPLSSMFDYANELRSMTQGKGQFSMEFLAYRQVPRGLQGEILERRRKEIEAKAAAK